MCGRWLVSRRIAWAPVVDEVAIAAHAADSKAAAGQAQGDGTATARAALPRAWTGFNNCTARITGELIRELVPPSCHFKEDWCKPETVAQFRALRAMQSTEAWH